MNREKSFIEKILKNNVEVSSQLNLLLNSLYEEVNQEIETIVHETVKEFCIEDITIALNKPFVLEIDLSDKELRGEIFYNIEFGLNVLKSIENKLFQREDLLEKLSILLPQAKRYYEFTINK